MLEIEVIKAKFKNQIATNIDAYINVNVDQFYGIEYEEFPAQIAQVAMWLIDHQMNIKVSEAFGEYFVRLPLKKSATIMHGNALRIDWQSLLEDEDHYNYILGNPPFVGAMVMDDSQRTDMKVVFENNLIGYGILDYVTAWYFKASKYSNINSSECGFVSTNSICQGEQVGILWHHLLINYSMNINFAHQTFKWNNEARGVAAVHCIIVGFGLKNKNFKRLFTYETVTSNPSEVNPYHINPYLVEGKNIFIENRKKPISAVPSMSFGSMPRDGGHLILSEQERNSLISKDKNYERWIRPYTGAQEFLNGYIRYCLWLVDISPSELKVLPEIVSRISKVREFRLESKAASTRKFAETPSIFCQIAQPQSDYLLIPRVSSERRRYIPIGFVSRNTIANDQVLTVANATSYHFGVISSAIHMVWVKYICGRLKSDYRYSKDIVYNNFPWPENPSEKQKQVVENAAQAVLDARAQYPDASLADLYDPNTMPPVLVKAHQALDKAVDLCYRPQPFPNETKRIEYLFELYDKYTSGLFVEEKKSKKKK